MKIRPLVAGEDEESSRRFVTVGWLEQPTDICILMCMCGIRSRSYGRDLHIKCEKREFILQTFVGIVSFPFLWGILHKTEQNKHETKIHGYNVADCLDKEWKRINHTSDETRHDRYQTKHTHTNKGTTCRTVSKKSEKRNQESR